MPQPTNEDIRARIQYSKVPHARIGDVYTQTWSDASSPEIAIGAPDGSCQEEPEYAILDSKLPWITACRTLSWNYFRYQERARSGTFICFGTDNDLLVANYCCCKQTHWDTQNIMLAYRMLDWQSRIDHLLECRVCKEAIGNHGPEQKDFTYFTHCEICLDTLCEKCSEDAAKNPQKRVKSLISVV